MNTAAPSPNTAQQDFDALARKLGLQPRDPWTGGDVDYEWDQLRMVLDVMPLPLPDMRVLEFGCNAGASAMLFSYLGARVSAVDASADWVALARLNAARHGIDDIDFSHVADARRLPFADGQFGLIACNSVLEHVAPAALAAVQRELDRVLAPGGMILLTGSSNRMWPREAHSGRWLVNYVPRWIDGLLGRPLPRGVWPWAMRRGFGPHYDNLDTARPDNFLLRARQRGGADPRSLRPLMWLARRLGVGPGMLTPNICCFLQKHPLS